MRRLTLLRHAKSSWDDESISDFDRPLNERGRRAAAAIGKHLAAKGVTFDLVLASPARRVVETLDGLAAGGWMSGPVRFTPAIYQASTRELLAIVQSAPDAAERLMLVGHNPVIAMLALQMTVDDGEGLRARVADNYPTGALAEIVLEVESWRDVTAQCGRLEAFTVPRSLPDA